MLQVSHLRMQAGVRIPFLSIFFLFIPFVVTRSLHRLMINVCLQPAANRTVKGSFHNWVDTPCAKVVLSSAGRLGQVWVS